MIDRLNYVWNGFVHALDLLWQNTAHVSPWWMLGGVLLHLLHQVVRIRGWFNILRSTYPKATGLRSRDVTAAFFAGSGLNAVIPARGGDVMKLYMVKQRIPHSKYATLVATFIPEGLFETVCGIALVIWAFTLGFIPVPTSRVEVPAVDISLIVAHPVISAIVAVAVAVGAVLLFRRLKRTAEHVIERIKMGFAILRTPRDYFTGVVTWQALGRVIRLGSLACFMAAFKIPVTLSSVLLVMAAQGGGRIIPIAPVSTGLRLAMLSYGLVEVTGKPVDIANITAFSVGPSLVLLVVTVGIALVIIFRELGTLNPKHAIVLARSALAGIRRRPVRAGAS
jgi:hypothetical protein